MFASKYRPKFRFPVTEKPTNSLKAIDIIVALLQYTLSPLHLVVPENKTGLTQTCQTRSPSNIMSHCYIYKNVQFISPTNSRLGPLTTLRHRIPLLSNDPFKRTWITKTGVEFTKMVCKSEGWPSVAVQTVNESTFWTRCQAGRRSQLWHIQCIHGLYTILRK